MAIYVASDHRSPDLGIYPTFDTPLASHASHSDDVPLLLYPPSRSIVLTDVAFVTKSPLRIVLADDRHYLISWLTAWIIRPNPIAQLSSQPRYYRPNLTRSRDSYS